MLLKTWQKYQKAVHCRASQAAEKHLQEAAEQVRQVYAEMNLGEPNDDGRLDIFFLQWKLAETRVVLPL